MVPGFSPSYRMVNGKRIYDLIPEKIALVKYTGSLPADETGADSGSNSGGSDSGSSSGGGSDNGSGGGTAEDEPIV